MVSFYLDSELDVTGFDDRYGLGVQVDISNYNAQPFTISAGELTFVGHTLPTDIAREDKNDTVIAEFHIEVQAGQNLLWRDVEFDIFADYNPVAGSCLNGGTTDIRDVLEEVELRDMTNGGSYDLSLVAGPAGAPCHVIASDNNVDISLPDSGDVTFRLVADIADNLPASIYGDEFYVEMRPSDVTENLLEEQDEGEPILDIVPSFLSFEALRFDQ